ncbi:cyanocobalamin reductase / alkylcobalamin dealkylase [Lepeophtheirus salmonis]|uniref:cyanocobalamin reductase / alkylcobalamin dealkylase n=1 Tax=Lepeophtheirus salmonis TaxID=72036 RepID=UPI001AEAC0EE|nr:cyanocobalamin reductase / alkylcobalamin dealkylase-like [Lepeophtheirus salmonis]
MEEIQNLLSKTPLNLDKGFETHPFLIGAYNEKVGVKFRLPFEDQTLAFVLISHPSMFENTFVPYLEAEGENEFLTDPLDACMKSLIHEARTHFHSSFPFIFYHDFDLHPNRRPKVLVQTAGHVSGAVHLYRSPNLNPVCLHPKYGGWFALRGVFIFPNISCPFLQIKEPPCLLKSIQDVEELLILYNYHWKDGRYRDFIPVEERYSNLQILYFKTLPSDRMPLLKKLFNKSNTYESKT